MTPYYDRDRLRQVLIFHQLTNDPPLTAICTCDWGRRPLQLGKSHADHVLDMYELLLVVEAQMHDGAL